MIVLADLALTHAKLGDMPTAAFLLGQTITVTAKVGGAAPTRHIYRCTQVCREFDPSRHGALLRELNDQLHAAALLV